VARGSSLILVSIDGRVVAKRDLTGGRTTFDFRVQLPSRDVVLTVTSFDDRGRRSSARVGPVFGLPRAAEPRAPPRRSNADGRLGRAVRALAQGFRRTCAIVVQDLRSGVTAAWNEEVAFPAASTLKVAIALEVLRVHRGKPPRGGRVDRLLHRMLIPSEDRAANELLVWLGGSTSGGSARVNTTLRALGLRNTDMYGGYEVQADQPSFVGKRTTASDFGRLLRQLHLAAGGKGQLARRFRGSFVPSDARFLLYLLAHARPSWLGRFLGGDEVAVVHKPGWIKSARHDAGVVYWRGGAFVAVVLTWNPRGVGTSSEVLAGHVARAALARLKGSPETLFAAPRSVTYRLAALRAVRARRSAGACRSRWPRGRRRR
jgi:beta-lactamase class A